MQKEIEEKLIFTQLEFAPGTYRPREGGVGRSRRRRIIRGGRREFTKKILRCKPTRCPVAPREGRRLRFTWPFHFIHPFRPSPSSVRISSVRSLSPSGWVGLSVCARATRTVLFSNFDRKFGLDKPQPLPLPAVRGVHEALPYAAAETSSMGLYSNKQYMGLSQGLSHCSARRTDGRR